jgi:hypothetical protein
MTTASISRVAAADCPSTIDRELVAAAIQVFHDTVTIHSGGRVPEDKSFDSSLKT